jgi:hypothetical protein
MKGESYMLFFVKVRVDVNKLAELGQKLQTGALHTHPVSTYCLKDDPSVGLNIWEAENQEAFEKAFAPHREYYSVVMETIPVITPQEAQKILMERMTSATHRER